MGKLLDYVPYNKWMKKFDMNVGMEIISFLN
jgi:hypothetical protein